MQIHMYLACRENGSVYKLAGLSADGLVMWAEWTSQKIEKIRVSREYEGFCAMWRPVCPKTMDMETIIAALQST